MAAVTPLRVPILSPILEPVLGARRRRGGGAVWTPALLFANGEQGAWYDPSDLSTLFQDAAGTTPVTATGQQVGLMLDKSGRGNHATQATAANRPVFRDVAGLRYLETDGVTDFMVTGNIDFTGTDKMTVCAGVRKLSDVATGVVIELSPDVATNNGAFSFRAPRTAAASFGWFSRGTSLADNTAIQPFAAPITVVFSGVSSIGTPQLNARINGGSWIANSASQGTGNYGNYPLYLFRRGGTSLPFNGHCYGLVIRGALTAGDDLGNLEIFIAQKTGVTL